jgi:hypothetical protein
MREAEAVFWVSRQVHTHASGAETHPQLDLFVRHYLARAAVLRLVHLHTHTAIVGLAWCIRASADSLDWPHPSTRAVRRADGTPPA